MFLIFYAMTVNEEFLGPGQEQIRNFNTLLNNENSKTLCFSALTTGYMIRKR